MTWPLQDNDKAEAALQQQVLLPLPPQSPAPKKQVKPAYQMTMEERRAHTHELKEQGIEIFKAPRRPRRMWTQAVDQSSDLPFEGALDVPLGSWAASSCASSTAGRQSHKADRSGLSRLLTSAAAMAAGSRELPDGDLGQQVSLLFAESQDWSWNDTTEKAREKVVQGVQRAAEALGERARGPVSLAIRAKTVCRMNISAATRRMIHLRGLGEEQSRQDESGEDSTEADDDENDPWASATGSRSYRACDLVEDEEPATFRQQSPRAKSFFAALLGKAQARREHPGGDEMQNLVSMQGGYGAPPPKRRIEVLNKTSLGRMVAGDPKRAQKYGLVLVPSWSHNKPWPPPPVNAELLGRRQPLWDINEGDRTRSLSDQGGTPPSRTPNRRDDGKQEVFAEQMPDERTAKMFKIVTKPNSSNKDDETTPRTKKGTLKSLESGTRKRLSLIEKAPDTLDYTMLLTKLEDWGMDVYLDAWIKATKMNPTYLTSSALCKVLKQVGLAPTNDKTRKRLSQVQHRIIEDFRSVEMDWKSETGVTNPLTDKRGGWMKKEFLAMIAVCRELQCLEQEDMDRAMAQESGCSIYDVQELREVYRLSAADDENLSMKGFVTVLKDMGMAEPTAQDMMAILESNSREELNCMRHVPFTTFIAAIIAVQRAFEDMETAPDEDGLAVAQKEASQESGLRKTQTLSAQLSVIRRKLEAQ